MCKAWSAPTSSVGGSYTCMAESGRPLSSGPWYGPSPRSSLSRGRASRLLPTGRLVRTVGLAGLEKVTALEGGHLIHARS
jgi:hypothetical protein